MITTLIFAVVGYAILAIVSILDKYILSGSVKKPIVYTFYSTIFFLVAFLVIPWCVAITPVDLIWSIISGLAFGFGLWSMFVGLKNSETSHLMPFLGGVVALATYVFSTILLGEVLTSSSQFGLVFLVSACFLLSFEKSRKHNGFHIGFLWAALAGILFGLSHVTAKHVYELYPFITGLVWTKGSVGFVGLLTLFWPGVLKTIFYSPQSKAEILDQKNKTTIVVIDKVLSVLGAVAIQYAIAIGSVTIINGMAGIQYTLMFIIIYSFTRFWPNVFSEYFTRREILVEICAILLVIIGFIFLK
jgi:drug/metabolite transporter (DMT)-like permease